MTWKRSLGQGTASQGLILFVLLILWMEGGAVRVGGVMHHENNAGSKAKAGF